MGGTISQDLLEPKCKEENQERDSPGADSNNSPLSNRNLLQLVYGENPADLCGIGVMFAEDPESGAKLVHDVSPASSCCGLLTNGDILDMIEGQAVAGMESAELGRLLMGPQGSSVRLTLRSAAAPQGGIEGSECCFAPASPSPGEAPAQRAAVGERGSVTYDVTAVRRLMPNAFLRPRRRESLFDEGFRGLMHIMGGEETRRPPPDDSLVI